MRNKKVLLAVDGNSLLHRSYHARAGSGLTTKDGRPTWAIHGFVSQLLAGVRRVSAEALVVGFDDPERNERKAMYPPYKATRSEKPEELTQQLQFAVDLLRAMGVQVIVPAGWEADDVLASAAHRAKSAGWHTVVMTSDRDAFSLISDTTSVLRVINGGIDGSPILTPARLETMLDVPPHQYLEYAAVRGDTSDNLPGIRGVGKVTAAKILGAFPTMAQAFADADTGGAALAAAAGKASVKKLLCPEGRAAFARNVQMMAMRTDVADELDLSTPAALLPLKAEQVVSALRELEIHSLEQSARFTLCATLAERIRGPETPQPPADYTDGAWELQEPPEEFVSPYSVHSGLSDPDLPARISASSVRPVTQPVPSSQGAALPDASMTNVLF